MDIADLGRELEKAKLEYRHRYADVVAQRAKDVRAAEKDKRILGFTIVSVLGTAFVRLTGTIGEFELIIALVAWIIGVAAALLILKLQDGPRQVEAVWDERLSSLDKHTKEYLIGLTGSESFLADS